jgi:hypothetical protein
MDTRNCPFCGKPVGITIDRCPYGREAIPKEQIVSRPFAEEGRAKIRRGLLYTLLAGIVYYFAGGYSGMHMPFAVPPFVTDILTPLLLLGGVGMTLYGVFLYLRS